MVAQRTGSKEETARKNETRAELLQAYRNLGYVVETKSNNDLSILLSSGFDARKNPTPSGPIEKPNDLQILPTAHSGSVKMSIAKVPSATLYMFQYALSPVTEESQWKTITGTTRTKIIGNLEPGKQYAFRVGAAGADPEISYSDVLMRFVA